MRKECPLIVRAPVQLGAPADVFAFGKSAAELGRYALMAR